MSTDIAAASSELTKIYGSGDTQVVALDSVSVQFQKGRFTAVLGPSGSGKSTLMHCIAGLDRPTSGRVFIGDVEISTMKDAQKTIMRREQIGFVFQAFNLVGTLNAAENILLPLAIAGKKPDPDWYSSVIDAVGLKDRLKHKPNQLSGGQQQRVACARALVAKPSIIFADEPTGNLDSVSSDEVLTFLQRAVKELGATVVMVTHDPNAAGRADQAIFLDDGSVSAVMENPTRERVLERMSRMSAEAVRDMELNELRKISVTSDEHRAQVVNGTTEEIGK